MGQHGFTPPILYLNIFCTRRGKLNKVLRIYDFYSGALVRFKFRLDKVIVNILFISETGIIYPEDKMILTLYKIYAHE